MTNGIQKIFGLTGPTGSISVFGSKKDDSLIYTNDVETIQSLPAWTNGMQGALIDDTKPTLQDLNAILYTLTYQNAYSQQNGIPAYIATEEYFIGSIVSYSGIGSKGYGGFYSLFVSKTDNNINNALTDEVYWTLLHSNYVRSVYQFAEVNNKDWFLIFNIGTATYLPELLLPDPSNNSGREIWYKYGTTGINVTLSVIGDTHVLSIDCADGSDPVVSAGKSVRLLCNGINWIATHIW